MQGQSSVESVAFSDYLTKAKQSNKEYVQELVTLLRVQGMTLSVIESMTGGGILRKLIESPGASAFLLGGVVAYDTRLKVQLGRVQPKTIATHGVVSHHVTEEMAKGIKTVTQSDISIATNGIAGPASEQYSADQSGTFFVSWNIRDKIIKTKRYKVEGGRNDVIDTAVYIALSMCLNDLKNNVRKDN